jgi:hypothetical protein
MQSKIRIGNYGQYSSSNYGSSRFIEIGDLTLYISYETVIAYKFRGTLVVRENDWKQTTGKHLNWIDGGNKKQRIPGTQFESQLNNVLLLCNLCI